MDKEEKIQVFIVDDQPYFTEGSKSLLEQYDNIEVVGTALTSKELFEKLETVQPHIILLDIEMPSAENGMDGFQIAEILKSRAEYEDIKVIVMSVNVRSATIRRMIEMIGVEGFLNKNTSNKEEVYEAIQDVVEWNCYISPELKGRTNKILGIETLTKREKEITKLIVEGHTSKEIHEKLFISFKTVTNHRQNINEKLNVNSVSKLMRRYYQYLYLHEDGDDSLPNFKKDL